jgi:hypothetical protein
LILSVCTLNLTPRLPSFAHSIVNVLLFFPEPCRYFFRKLICNFMPRSYIYLCSIIDLQGAGPLPYLLHPLPSRRLLKRIRYVNTYK